MSDLDAATIADLRKALRRAAAVIKCAREQISIGRPEYALRSLNAGLSDAKDDLKRLK